MVEVKFGDKWPRDEGTPSTNKEKQVRDWR